MMTSDEARKLVERKRLEQEENANKWLEQELVEIDALIHAAAKCGNSSVEYTTSCEVSNSFPSGYVMMTRFISAIREKGFRADYKHSATKDNKTYYKLSVDWIYERTGEQK